MDGARQRALLSLETTAEVPIVTVTEDDLHRWILPSEPLHPAFKHLSAVHKSDYLRAYLLNSYGGGYSDVKGTTASWLPAFSHVRASHSWVVGYRERRRVDVASFGLETRPGGLPVLAPKDADWWRWRLLHVTYPLLLGCSAMICEPHTPFTRAWMAAINKKLDRLTVALTEHPALTERARLGDGSGYPVAWTALLGDIFHPLCLRWRPLLCVGLPGIVRFSSDDVK